MEITMNGEACEVLPTDTLQSFLEKQLEDLRGIAVAVNNTVVPKPNWEATQLQEQDNVLVITAAKGG